MCVCVSFLKKHWVEVSPIIALQMLHFYLVYDWSFCRKVCIFFGWFWGIDFGVGGDIYAFAGDESSPSFTVFSRIVTSKEIDLLLDHLIVSALFFPAFSCHACP